MCWVEGLCSQQLGLSEPAFWRTPNLVYMQVGLQRHILFLQETSQSAGDITLAAWMLRVLPFGVQVLGFPLQGFMPTFHCAHSSLNFIPLSQRVSELQDCSPNTDFERTLHPSLAQYFVLPFRVTWSLNLAVTIPINKNHLNFQSFLTFLYKMPASQGHHND